MARCAPLMSTSWHNAAYSSAGELEGNLLLQQLPHCIQTGSLVWPLQLFIAGESLVLRAHTHIHTHACMYACISTHLPVHTHMHTLNGRKKRLQRGATKYEAEQKSVFWGGEDFFFLLLISCRNRR